MSFEVSETTIADVHEAYRSGVLTCHQLVRHYLDRIEAVDKRGPALNSVITVNPRALDEADRLDAALASAEVVGPLHGIPVIVKDQCDSTGMPTTLGSVLLKDYYPDRDAFVVERLKKAGAVILAKSTLGELAGGDSHGSLFGSTKNPYDLERTAGGSSGGSGAALSANLCTVAVGQEGYASIRRPAAWNSVVGMRPTAGLVSRSGVYAGWPSVTGALGPMARTVTDLTRLLDVMVGYDAEDPLTARGAGRVPGSFAGFLDENGLRGARIGILREVMGHGSDPASEDFAKVDEVFSAAVTEMASAGAEIIDPVIIPDLASLLGKRASLSADEDESFARWMSRSQWPPFRSRQEAMATPAFQQVRSRSRQRWLRSISTEAHYQYLRARDRLMTNLLQVMADARLDAIVHKAVEHQPTLIEQALSPPFVDQRGATHLNTFLVYVPSVTVPAGFTSDRLPTGIAFLGRPYDDGNIIKLAYGYEQATHHRIPPPSDVSAWAWEPMGSGAS